MQNNIRLRFAGAAMYFLLHFYRPCATIAVSIEDLRMCAGMGTDKKLKNFVIKTAVKTFLIVLAVAVAGFIIFNFAFPQHMASFAERVGNYDMALKYASLRYSYTGSTDDLARCFEDAILAGDDEAILEYGDEFFEKDDHVAVMVDLSVKRELDYSDLFGGSLASARYGAGDIEGAMELCGMLYAGSITASCPYTALAASVVSAADAEGAAQLLDVLQDLEPQSGGDILAKLVEELAKLSS